MFEIRTDNVHTSTVSTASDGIAKLRESLKLHEWVDDRYSKPADAENDAVTVAVMDSGISDRAVGPSADHEHGWFHNTEITKRHDVTGNGPGNDSVGHGTGVASIIAENTPPIEMYSVKIFGDTGSTGMSEIREAYEWLIAHSDEIDVVNMSWGATQDVPEINQLHEELISNGVQDVVAAGNTGSDGGSPATSPSAFSAGAVDEDGKPVRFSSFDPDQGNPDVAAIGKNVVMARVPGTSMGVPLNPNWTKASGTSFSAPFTTAAIVHGIYRKKQSWTSAFKRSAEDIKGVKKDGAGIMKLKPTLKSLEKDSSVSASVWNFKGQDTVWMDADWLHSMDDTKVTKLGETDDYIDIRIEK